MYFLDECLSSELAVGTFREKKELYAGKHIPYHPSDALVFQLQVQLQTFFAVLRRSRPHNAGQHPMPRGARSLKNIALALAYVVLQRKPDEA
jgi:hypothetical protein